MAEPRRGLPGQGARRDARRAQRAAPLPHGLGERPDGRGAVLPRAGADEGRHHPDPHRGRPGPDVLHGPDHRPPERLALARRAHGVRARRPRRRRLRHAGPVADRRSEPHAGPAARPRPAPGAAGGLAVPHAEAEAPARARRDGQRDDHPGRAPEHLPARAYRPAARAARAPRGRDHREDPERHGHHARHARGPRDADRHAVRPRHDRPRRHPEGRAPGGDGPDAVRARVRARDGDDAVLDRRRPDQLQGDRAPHRRDRRLPRHHERDAAGGRHEHARRPERAV